MLNFNTKRKRTKTYGALHRENKKLWHQGQTKNSKVDIEMFDQKYEKHKLHHKMFT